MSRSRLLLTLGAFSSIGSVTSIVSGNVSTPVRTAEEQEGFTRSMAWSARSMAMSTSNHFSLGLCNSRIWVALFHKCFVLGTTILHLSRVVRFFRYMTCDAVDGKHARNTKQSTPLGAVAACLTLPRARDAMVMPNKLQVQTTSLRFTTRRETKTKNIRQKRYNYILVLILRGYEMAESRCFP